MSILTKRAQILFNPKEYERLKSLAKQGKTSVGGLVRRALEKAYPSISQQRRIQAAQALTKQNDLEVDDWEVMEAEVQKRWVNDGN